MPRMPQNTDKNIIEEIILLSNTEIKPDEKFVDVFFFNDNYLPTEITDWEKENVSASIKDTGLAHVYTSDKKYYTAFAYPVSLGSLECIYQNDTAFNIIEGFEKFTVKKDEKHYYLYRFSDKISAGSDKFEFLWKVK